jgi:hypothetical protein
MCKDIEPISADDLASILVKRIEEDIIPDLPEGTTVDDVLRMYMSTRPGKPGFFD